LRYLLLDLVRVFAIGLIVAGHIGQATGGVLAARFGVEQFYYVSWAGLGVTLFIVLSGLVLELSYGAKAVRLGPFMLRRALRIYPVYWMCIAIALVRYFAGRVTDGTLRQTLGGMDLIDPFCWLTGLYVFFGRFNRMGGEVLPTAWFIGTIMTLYLFYPLLSRCIRRRPHATLLLLLAVTVGSRTALGRWDVLPRRALDWFVLCRIFEFGLGVYLVRVLKPGVWSCLNAGPKLARVVGFLSSLSFPFYLGHDNCRFLLALLPRHGIGLGVAVPAFLAASFVLSTVLWFADQRVPRQRILERSART